MDSEHVDLTVNICVCSRQHASEAIPVLTSDGAGDETFMTGGPSTCRTFIHWESSQDDIIMIEPKKSLKITRHFFHG